MTSVAISRRKQKFGVFPYSPLLRQQPPINPEEALIAKEQEERRERLTRAINRLNERHGFAPDEILIICSAIQEAGGTTLQSRQAIAASLVISEEEAADYQEWTMTVIASESNDVFSSIAQIAHLRIREVCSRIQPISY